MHALHSQADPGDTKKNPSMFRGPYVREASPLSAVPLALISGTIECLEQAQIPGGCFGFLGAAFVSFDLNAPCLILLSVRYNLS